MDERQAFLDAIAAGPWDDEVTRLVYADWLDEHGEHEEADRQRKHIPVEPHAVPVDPAAQCKLTLQRRAAAANPDRATQQDQRIPAQDRDQTFDQQVSRDQRAIEIEHQWHRYRKIEQQSGSSSVRQSGSNDLIHARYSVVSRPCTPRLAAPHP